MKNNYILKYQIAILVLTLSSVLIVSCSSVDSAIAEKLDQPLRDILFSETKYEGESLFCTIQIDKNLDGEIKREIEQTGLKILTNFISIITVEGKFESIKKAAALPYVIRIEADKKRNTQN